MWRETRRRRNRLSRGYVSGDLADNVVAEHREHPDARPDASILSPDT